VRKVWVRREDLASGALPEVCVITGQPTDIVARTRFESLPDWTWLLLLFGVLPFLVALAFASERIPALIPLSQDAIDRRRGHRRRAFLSGGAAVALFALAAVAESVVLVWLALVALVLVLVSLLGRSRSLPRVRPDRSGLGVWLRGVHPRFVEAVETRDGADTDRPRVRHVGA
jgi:hypothetical protein